MKNKLFEHKGNNVFSLKKNILNEVFDNRLTLYREDPATGDEIELEVEVEWYRNEYEGHPYSVIYRVWDVKTGEDITDKISKEETQILERDLDDILEDPDV